MKRRGMDWEGSSGGGMEFEDTGTSTRLDFLPFFEI